MTLSVDLANLPGANANANQGRAGGVAAAVQAKKTGGSKKKDWSVPDWNTAFDLIDAKASAYALAQNHLNTMLEGDNLEVELTADDALGGANPNEVMAYIRDKDTARLITTYSGIDVLRLFTHNTKPKGVVADGAI